MTVHGHESLLRVLHTTLPAASLFEGPHSVGRWKMAEHLRWYYNIDPDDVLRFHDLDVENVRTLREFVLTRPAKSPYKLVIVELYKASHAAQVALTSVLEDPGHSKIIVIGQSSEVLPGVRSRTVPFRFRFLTPDQVTSILTENMNFGSDRAKDLAQRSGGQVFQALRLADAEETILLVRQALKALRNQEEDDLAALATKWTDEATAYLAQWCAETVSGQWRVFDHEDYVAGRALPMKILVALRARVRPRLVIRSQLMSVLRGG